MAHQVTIEKLTELQACRGGVDWFQSHYKPDDNADLSNVLRALLADNRSNWANWLIARYLDKPQRVRYAIFAAEQVLHIFEDKYPDDKRPSLAIDAAKKYLEDPSEENINAADAAAYAAYAADAAAAYAEYAAAAAAAAAAADAAAYAAYADAADAAAYAAYADAADARRNLQIKIIDYGLGLLGYQGADEVGEELSI